MLLTGRIAGAGLLALLWLGPLPALAQVSLTAHMILHVGVVALVPALLRVRVSARLGGALPALAVLAEMVVVWGWHLPAPHIWASIDDTGFVLQQASFLAAGIAVWSLADAAGRLAAPVMLMVTGMHMAMLGIALTLAPAVLYPGVCGGGPFGLGPLEDQQMAGIVMAVFAPAVYLAGGLARLAPLLSERRAA
ncbi:MAG TPA: cytochrome c oxidase assembly protein [Thermohalobaculum sp.]|nr:cytochrome c oxidase assembly protein [Thermohalobaculum sp.]